MFDKFKKEEGGEMIEERIEGNVNIIFFMNSSLKNPEVGQNIKFLQIGELNINSEKPISSNQEFRNSISMR